MRLSAARMPLQTFLLFTYFSLSQSSFVCDFISSTNISSISTFYGWECQDGLPVGDPCEWSQVKCSFGQIITLDLSYRNISGTLPNTIHELQSLRHLYMDENLLHSTLPASLGQLTNLRGIQLSGNHFNGHIPDLSSLSKLTSLYLNYNSFSGPLPSSPAHLNKLLYLSLEHNNFTGTIPSVYNKLMNHLVALDITDNQLTGEIPLEFCKTNTVIYSFRNNLIDRCEECTEKGCNRSPILNNFNQGLFSRSFVCCHSSPLGLTKKTDL